MTSKTAIIIPARYASTRFPGKPLAKICGQEMLLRVHTHAKLAAQGGENISIYVATDDQRISNFCQQHEINCVQTSQGCETGTDRIAEALDKIETPDFVVNLQGDNPLCPPYFISELIDYFNNNHAAQVVTPVTKLTWQALDELRKNKQSTPFSGTCAVLDKSGDAMYFSKNIIPAIRKEDEQRQQSDYSPVLRHIGLYGYSTEVLKKLPSLPQGTYEPHEGLEQMRFLENGIKVACVEVKHPNKAGLAALGGVDSPEDLQRAEDIINKYGERWYD